MRFLFIIIMICFFSSAERSVAEDSQSSGIYSSKVYEKKTRPFSLYEHDIHNEKIGMDDCAFCHHLYEDGKLLAGESSEDQYCSDCHGIIPTEKNTVSLTKAFHLRCRSCHEEKWNGPVFCGECHIRKKYNKKNAGR